jgi:hypothetical protein
MPRSLLAALAALLLLPAAASAKPLPHATPIDVSQASDGSDPGIPDPDAPRHFPDWLRSWAGSDLHSAADYPGPVAKEEQYQDEHGHVITLGTDNGAVDLQPFANLLASTYHGDEIQSIKVFVTSTASLEEFCGSDALACYTALRGHSDGLMVVSYESDTGTMIHAVIHEYGHHIDNNTYNLAGIYGCTLDGDGSRRWYLLRQQRDNIVRKLSCDRDADWGHTLAEVYAEDYAQMVGIPRSEYHPAVVVRPPTDAILAGIKADIDEGFEPKSGKVTGRSHANRKVVGKLKLGSAVPVFLQVRKAKGVKAVGLSGCGVARVPDFYFGTCRVTIKTKKPNQRFSFTLVKR